MLKACQANDRSERVCSLQSRSSRVVPPPPRAMPKAVEAQKATHLGLCLLRRRLLRDERRVVVVSSKLVHFRGGHSRVTHAILCPQHSKAVSGSAGRALTRCWCAVAVELRGLPLPPAFYAPSTRAYSELDRRASKLLQGRGGPRFPSNQPLPSSNRAYAPPAAAPGVPAGAFLRSCCARNMSGSSGCWVASSCSASLSSGRTLRLRNSAPSFWLGAAAGVGLGGAGGASAAAAGAAAAALEVRFLFILNRPCGRQKERGSASGKVAQGALPQRNPWHRQLPRPDLDERRSFVRLLVVRHVDHLRGRQNAFWPQRQEPQAVCGTALKTASRPRAQAPAHLFGKRRRRRRRGRRRRVSAAVLRAQPLLAVGLPDAMSPVHSLDLQRRLVVFHVPLRTRLPWAPRRASARNILQT